MDTLDNLHFCLREVFAFFHREIAVRSWQEWLFFFMPFYVFGEFPHYVMPTLVLLAQKLVHPFAGRSHEEQKEAFLATHPRISVLLVGYNEEDAIANAIESLLELEYEGLDIVVVDDNSTDDMYRAAQPYAERGLIRLFKNTAASGRAGRPTASNYALAVAEGDFILSVDADTSFDRNTLLHMIGPFYDPAVGAVAGNLKVRNVGSGLVARMQAIEYFISIGLWKRWLNLVGMNLQASGAFGAFRRQALQQCGGWDPELAEDADVSLKIKRQGWSLVFEPYAIAMTNVPPTLTALSRQRYRWDRGMLRTYFHKHGSLLNFRTYNLRITAAMLLEYFFSVVLTFLYVFWLGYMLWRNPMILIFVYVVCYAVYTLSTGISVGVALLFSERRDREWPLLFAVPLFAPYKGYLRWVRLYALAMEVLQVNYEDSYLPQSAWRNTERW